MSKKARRKYTVEDKIRILEEAREPNTTVSEVLRRHQVDPTTFYRWERQAKTGMREALEGRVRRNGLSKPPPSPPQSTRNALGHGKNGAARVQTYAGRRNPALLHVYAPAARSGRKANETTKHRPLPNFL